MPGERNGPIADAMIQIPNGLFVVTAAFEEARSGVLAHWVQQCSTTPPMIMVAMAKGQPVEPLIRDSRAFALCQVGADDRLLHRKFATAPDRHDDPFISLSTRCAPSGAPIVERALSYLDCELVRLIDIEADHLVYIAQVLSGGVLHEATPAVFYGCNGSNGRHGAASSAD
ncbi:MAG: flavin reductase family protein [Planctomycetota bacterium]|jgi:flavin reductase (DIM6/NTAB) family NADH-FMN oxidoreductase RutF